MKLPFINFSVDYKVTFPHPAKFKIDVIIDISLNMTSNFWEFFSWTFFH